MNRERLFARLGTTCYGALVDATALGRARQHAFVDLDHWALNLLRRPDSDFSQLLAEIGCDVADVKHRLEAALQRVRPSGDSLRDISPELERSVAPAITWSQIAAPATQVRSGHLLLAWFDEPATQRWLKSLAPRALGDATLETLLARYEALAPRWAEAAEGASTAPSLAGTTADTNPSGDALSLWGTCLTAQAAEDKLDPVVGRHDELRAVIDILLRRRQNNPILVGEAGVGKTAVVEALAQHIHAGHMPPLLQGAQLWALDLTRMQAGASARGEFEQRLRSVLVVVEASPHPIILFCDEAHTLIGAGGNAGTGDAVNLIKPMLARGQLRMIAATTWSEYKQFIEPDAALVRRFQTVAIDEPDDRRAIDMLRVIAPKFAAHHGVEISQAALSAAVHLSRRYLPARQLPDKAIGLLDTACARVAMSQSGAPAVVDRLQHDILTLDQALHWRQNDLRLGLPTSNGAELDLRKQALHQELSQVSADVEQQRHSVKKWLDGLATANEGHASQPLEWTTEPQGWVRPWVCETAIAEVLAEWTGIPCAQLAQSEASRLVQLPRLLAERIHGQDDALRAMAQSLQVARSGLSDPDRPLGVMMLAGPTGTGKSQTATALAELLFGGERHLLQFNMNEFQESHTVSTLKGAPPGYVGYGKGGRLTEAVRKKPYCVLLLDEFDRAHADIHDLFYQVFDQGWMEDGEGRRISFRNCLILLTTNQGEAEISAAVKANPEVSTATLDTLAREKLQRHFAPALMARMQVLAYRPLSEQALAGIADQALQELGRRVAASGLRWQIAPEVAPWIANTVADHASGGRAVRDFVRRHIVPHIAQRVLAAQADNQPLHTVRLLMGHGLELAFDDDAAPASNPASPSLTATEENTTCA